MKVFIAFLIFGLLVGLILLSSPAQQNQNPQQSAQEIEDLKKRVSELEKQLQIVENVEKMELQAKLAEANAKLHDAEFATFEKELKDSNSKWLRGWILFFLAILSGVGIVVVREFRTSADKLIKNEVEKNLNGFKEGLEEVGTLKNEIGILKDQQTVLEREHTSTTLASFLHANLWHQEYHPEQIKVLREEALLDAFGDKGRIQAIRYKAIEVLVARQSPQSVPPILEVLNSVLDSDADFGFETKNTLRAYIGFLGDIHTAAAYEGLRKFLNRLLTESPKHKDSFLMETVLAFGCAAIELNMRDSVSILRSAMPHLQHSGYEDLSILVEYFDRFSDSAGIKEILTKHVTSGMPEVERQCLDALEKYDSEFVEKWREQNRADDTNSS